jgi:predicted nucleic acid-binding protein
VTLCDTGPLVALIDGDDPHHQRCAEGLRALPAEPLVTTWPCFVEPIYLLGRAGGHPAQEELWGYLADGLVILHMSTPAELDRMRELMRTYRDTPMDLADASLVAAAEVLGLDRVFTLDQHFHAYRIENARAFRVVP